MSFFLSSSLTQGVRTGRGSRIGGGGEREGERGEKKKERRGGKRGGEGKGWGKGHKLRQTLELRRLRKHHPWLQNNLSLV